VESVELVMLAGVLVVEVVVEVVAAAGVEAPGIFVEYLLHFAQRTVSVPWIGRVAVVDFVSSKIGVFPLLEIPLV